MRNKWIERVFRCILPAFFAAVLLSGCTKPEAYSQPEGTERPAPETVRIDIFDPSPTTEPVFELETYAVSDQKGLYDLLPVLGEEGQTLLHAGFTKAGKIRLLSAAPDRGGLVIEDFDLRTGLRSSVYSGNMDDQNWNPDDYGIEGIDPPLLYDYDTGELILFSSDCASFERYSVKNRALGGLRWDGQSLLFFDIVADRLSRAEPGKKETVLIETDYHFRIDSLLSVSEDGRYASLLATDNYTGASGTLLFDLADGSVSGWTEGETYLCFSEKGYSTVCRAYDWEGERNITTMTFRIADTLSSGEIHETRYEKEDFYPLIAAVPGGYLIENWDTGYALYKADASGQRISGIEFPMEQYVQEGEAYLAGMQRQEPGQQEEPKGVGVVWDDIDDDWSVYANPQTYLENASDGRFVLTTIRFGEETGHLLLWDSEQGEIVSDHGITMAEPLFEPVQTVRADYGEFQERVASIRDKYGVTVLLGEEADLKIGTHTTTVLPVGKNPEGISLALDSIESALSQYPPGFFGILSGGETGRVVVELCGTIRAAGEDSLDYPSALTCTIGEIRLLALDAAYLPEMRYTVFHEIAHMIDDRLESEAWAEDDPFWSEEKWDALNPDGFSYYYAYNDENGELYDLNGSVRYTEQDKDYQKKKKTAEVYFIDTYSKTFPTEDRAVLMGTLLTDNTKDELLRCPHILEKLEYYSEAIRQYFDPDGTLWKEPTIWERRIEELKSGAARKAA